MKEIFEMLDDLQESGQINMMGAPSVLVDLLGISKFEARDIVLSWMKMKESA
jgi:hypothetical protein